MSSREQQPPGGFDRNKERRAIRYQLLSYFETGALPASVQKKIQQELADKKGASLFPTFVRPRLLKIQGILFAVSSVELSDHPLSPEDVKEAFVTFDRVEEERDIPPWKVVQPNEWLESHGAAAWTFTTALSLEENLREFAQSMAAPGPAFDDLTSLAEHMAARRRESPDAS